MISKIDKIQDAYLSTKANQISGEVEEIDENDKKQITLKIKDDEYAEIVLKKEINEQKGEKVSIDRRNIESVSFFSKKDLEIKKVNQEQISFNQEKILKDLGVDITKDSKEAIDVFEKEGISFSKENIESYVFIKKQFENISKNLDKEVATKLENKNIDVENIDFKELSKYIDDIKESKSNEKLFGKIFSKKEISTQEAEEIAEKIYGSKMGKDITDIIKVLHKENGEISKDKIDKIYNSFSKLRNIDKITSEDILKLMKNELKASIENLYKAKNYIKSSSIETREQKSFYGVYKSFENNNVEISTKDLERLETSIEKILTKENVEINLKTMDIAKKIVNSKVDLNKENIEKVENIQEDIEYLQKHLNINKIAELEEKGIDVSKIEIEKLKEEVVKLEAFEKDSKISNEYDTEDLKIKIEKNKIEESKSEKLELITDEEKKSKILLKDNNQEIKTQKEIENLDKTNDVKKENLESKFNIENNNTVNLKENKLLKKDNIEINLENTEKTDIAKEKNKMTETEKIDIAKDNKDASQKKLEVEYVKNIDKLKSKEIESKSNERISKEEIKTIENLKNIDFKEENLKNVNKSEEINLKSESSLENINIDSKNIETNLNDSNSNNKESDKNSKSEKLLEKLENILNKDVEKQILQVLKLEKKPSLENIFQMQSMLQKNENLIESVPLQSAQLNLSMMSMKFVSFESIAFQMKNDINFTMQLTSRASAYLMGQKELFKRAKNPKNLTSKDDNKAKVQVEKSSEIETNYGKKNGVEMVKALLKNSLAINKTNMQRLYQMKTYVDKIAEKSDFKTAVELNSKNIKDTTLIEDVIKNMDGFISKENLSNISKSIQKSSEKLTTFTMKNSGKINLKEAKILSEHFENKESITSNVKNIIKKIKQLPDKSEISLKLSEKAENIENLIQQVRPKMKEKELSVRTFEKEINDELKETYEVVSKNEFASKDDIQREFKNLSQKAAIVNKAVKQDQMLQIPMMFNDIMSNLQVYVKKDSNGNSAINEKDMSIILSLETKNMGILKINLSVKNDQVVARFLPKDEKDKKSIDNNMIRFEQMLKEIGLGLRNKEEKKEKIIKVSNFDLRL